MTDPEPLPGEAALREFLAAEDAGAGLAHDAILAAHPDCRDELTAYFETTARMARCRDWLLPERPPLPDSIPGFELESEIGRGGMGVVYRARQPHLGRSVALKLLRAEDAAIADRLLAEARAAARLDHPGIVPIFETGRTDGRPYLAMALVAGPTLAAVGRQPPRTAARIVRDAALAVQHAHDHGVIHRDLKPGNILLAADGVPKITDFGLAKRSGEATLSQDGQVLGTPAYMPPEFAAGAAMHAGPAADVYGLGAVLYFLLTGRAPFAGVTPLETIRRVIDDEPVPPRTIDPGIHRSIEAVCRHCLEKEPARRYATARELADDLDRCLADEVPHAERLGWRDWLGRKLDRAVDFPDARAWSRLCFATAVALMVVPPTIQLSFGVAPPWAAFAVALVATAWIPCLLAAICLRLDHRAREIWLFWLAVCLGQTSLLAVYTGSLLYAEWATLYAVMFFSQGRLYWGRLFALALFIFALVPFMAAFPHAAPTLYGTGLAVSFGMIALRLRRIARPVSRTVIPLR
jgi:serine/threonine protein kinase